MTETELRRAFKMCQLNLNGAWTNAKHSEVSIRKLSGGMSNLLYHCALKQHIETQTEPKEVLLRLYGSSHGDMNVQLEIFNRLASENLGPKLYCSFDEGRFEEYLPSYPLSLAEMTDDEISAVIASKIAAIHKLNLDSLDKKPNWLLENYNLLYEFILNKTKSPIRFADDTRESTKSIAYQMFGINFRAEIDFLEKLFQRSKAPLVFSHNDLHQNNILLLIQNFEEDQSLQDRVVLIDFEYCNYNYRPFDLANHLSEWCFDYNGDEYPHFNASFERFPSEEQQKKFLTNYLKHGTNCFSDSNNTCDIRNSRSASESANKIKDIDVDYLYEEMQPFLMASNLLWTMWAIKSACTSEIDFGYWEMAMWKWEIYLLCKRSFIEKTEPGCVGDKLVILSKM